VSRFAGANIIRADVVAADPTGVCLVVRGLADPITFFCESNEQRAKVCERIFFSAFCNDFLLACRLCLKFSTSAT
jgi:hypothetical protein